MRIDGQSSKSQSLRRCSRIFGLIAPSSRRGTLLEETQDVAPSNAFTVPVLLEVLSLCGRRLRQAIQGEGFAALQHLMHDDRELAR